MNNTIKKILGPNAYANLRASALTLRSLTSKKAQISGAFEVIEEKRRNVFFGYYDLPQFSEDESKLLVHSVPLRADPTIDDAEIKIYNREDKTLKPLAITHTWCWQQGARLRWHPNNKDSVMFNDIVGGHYVCRIINTVTNDEVIIPEPIYDFDNAFTYGLSLNFSRLQRLRPGYGYYRLKDETIDKDYTDKDGIYQCDIAADKTRLIISLEQLAEDIEQKDLYVHYINHISISPSGKAFMFFHIMSPKKGGNWYTRLMVCDKDGKNLRTIEDRYKVSHYCWKNDEELIVTCYEGKRQFYNVYNISRGDVKPFYYNVLTKDGHPSCFSDQKRIITDTYPDRQSYQDLAIINNGSYEKIGRFYHNPFFGADKRCDLHPRLSPGESAICIDTTYHGGKRNCVIIPIG